MWRVLIFFQSVFLVIAYDMIGMLKWVAILSTSYLVKWVFSHISGIWWRMFIRFQCWLFYCENAKGYESLTITINADLLMFITKASQYFQGCIQFQFRLNKKLNISWMGQISSQRSITFDTRLFFWHIMFFGKRSFVFESLHYVIHYS